MIDSCKPIEDLDERFIYIIRRGSVARCRDGRMVEQLEAGNFFGEDVAVFSDDYQSEFIVQEPLSGYRLHIEHIREIPIIRWKLLETHQKRIRAIRARS